MEESVLSEGQDLGMQICYSQRMGSDQFYLGGKVISTWRALRKASGQGGSWRRPSRQRRRYG